MDCWITQALPAALTFAASLLNDRAQAEDIVQDCVCRLLAQGARYDLARDGRKLLFRAITNASINHLTRTRKMASLDYEGRSPTGGTWEVADARAVPPPSLAMAAELRRAIGEGLSTLPVRQRAALELSSLGHRHDEIAEMLAVEPEHLRVLLFRARKSLAAHLNQRYFGGVTP
ncbi:MAG: sigma-70 family RNA polymerase sigma factor [Singulisphaera sp.]